VQRTVGKTKGGGAAKASAKSGASGKQKKWDFDAEQKFMNEFEKQAEQVFKPNAEYIVRQADLCVRFTVSEPI